MDWKVGSYVGTLTGSVCYEETIYIVIQDNQYEYALVAIPITGCKRHLCTSV